MYAYIKGKLVMKFNNYIIIENNDIGYKIFMSESAIDGIGEVGEIIKIFTYYHVREDEISLYGFKTGEELNMFELLISVSGIGAKSAISMLSNITPSSFALAVISNDVSKLTKIPGVGPKSAQRIILELKDKLKTQDNIIKENKQIEEAVIDDNKTSEAIQALQVLGYNRKEIEKALEKFDKDNLKVEDIIRKALASLGSTH